MRQDTRQTHRTKDCTLVNLHRDSGMGNIAIGIFFLSVNVKKFRYSSKPSRLTELENCWVFFSSLGLGAPIVHRGCAFGIWPMERRQSVGRVISKPDLNCRIIGCSKAGNVSVYSWLFIATWLYTAVLAPPTTAITLWQFALTYVEVTKVPSSNELWGDDSEWNSMFWT